MSDFSFAPMPKAKASTSTEIEVPTFHAMTSEQALALLKVTPNGLKESEALERLAVHGPNVLPRRQGDGPLRLLWNQINNPLIWVLIGSAVVAAWADPDGGMKNGGVILGVVVLNTLIGFVQEFRASRAIASLVHLVPENAVVVRDGNKKTIAASELVPGDVVSLASGDKVPADLRLLEERNLQAEESALTGESVPSRKETGTCERGAQLGDRRNMLFGGTLITSGTASAVVTATGSSTELGRISRLIDSATSLQTPLTQALATIGKWITIGIVTITALLLAMGTWRAMNETGVDLLTALRETAIFAIALAVGAIPEGLPAVVTIALAVGVQRMAKRRAIVRQLPSVETLGSTSVICSDKTGTLTRNEMTVQALWTPSGHVHTVTGVGYDPSEGKIVASETGERTSSTHALHDGTAQLLWAGALCNDSELRKRDDGRWEIAGDPTEGALLTSAAKAGFSLADLRAAHPRVDAIPFESENQFMATLHSDVSSSARDNTLVLKGAPEVVLSKCANASELKETVAIEVARMASRGMRVLGFARKRLPADHRRVATEDTTSDFEFLGLQAMIDPPRPETIQAIEVCKRAGICVKMITGDHSETARAIGRQIGILAENGEALSGREIAELSDEDLSRAASTTNVFARVAPEHKLRLVRILQKEGHVVAMTGDGVNDAPALRQANIGVAMGIAGTAVSKEAADIVLADDNFASIAAAVEEGRRVYDNLIKSLAFLLPTNLGLAFILMYAVLFFPFQDGALLVPILPTQILWINLVASVTLALPLAFEAQEPNVMARPPRSAQTPVLNRFVLFRTVVAAIFMTASAIMLFKYEFSSTLATGASFELAVSEAQTLAVTSVVFFQIFYMLNCRSLMNSIREIGYFSNRTVFVGIATLLVLQAAFVYAPPLQRLFGTLPLTMEDLGLAALAGLLIFPVIAVEKFVRRRRWIEI